jgi:hypothetical protein
LRGERTCVSERVTSQLSLHLWRAVRHLGHSLALLSQRKKAPPC